MSATTTLKRCPLCSYRLDGLPTEHRCPECGFTYDQDTQVFKASIREDAIAMVVMGTVSTVFLVSSLTNGYLNLAFVCFIAGPILLCNIACAIRFLRKSTTLVVLSKADLCVRRKGHDMMTLERTELVAAEYSFVTGGIDVRTNRGWQSFPLNVRFFGTNRRSRAFVKTVNTWIEANQPPTQQPPANTQEAMSAEWAGRTLSDGGEVETAETPRGVLDANQQRGEA